MTRDEIIAEAKRLVGKRVRIHHADKDEEIDVTGMLSNADVGSIVIGGFEFLYSTIVSIRPNEPSVEEQLEQAMLSEKIASVHFVDGHLRNGYVRQIRKQGSQRTVYLSCTLSNLGEEYLIDRILAVLPVEDESEWIAFCDCEEWWAGHPGVSGPRGMVSFFEDEKGCREYCDWMNNQKANAAKGIQ